MKQIALRIFLAFLLSATGFASFAQTSSCSAGQSRKTAALYTVLRETHTSLNQKLNELISLAERIEADIVDMNTSVGILETETVSLIEVRDILQQQAERRRNCFEDITSGSIYWPSHKNADSAGCVEHAKLWTTP